MPLDDIIDGNTGDIRVNITDQMREAAKPVVKAYDGYMARTHGSPTLMRQMTPERSAYEGKLQKFKEAVYDANPHLDPSAMVKSDDTTPMYTQRIDMERASGKPLNDLLAEVARAEGTAAPRPFDEKIRGHH